MKIPFGGEYVLQQQCGFSSIRDHLPPLAQDIYRFAFNQTFMTYSGFPNREEIAERVGWRAVKRSNVKDRDCWVRRSEISSMSQQVKGSN